jgi:hypothetical protein
MNIIILAGRRTLRTSSSKPFRPTPNEMTTSKPFRPTKSSLGNGAHAAEVTPSKPSHPATNEMVEAIVCHINLR